MDRGFYIAVVVFIVSVSLLFFMGCGHKIDSGKVVGKYFREAHTTTVLTPMLVGKVMKTLVLKSEKNFISFFNNSHVHSILHTWIANGY